MASGGAREGAGRIPLARRQDCVWIIGRIQELGRDPEFLSTRIEQFVKRQYPDHHQNQVELQEHYEKIQQLTIDRRQAIIANDLGTSLEEIREIRAMPGFPIYMQLPSPNQFQLNQIYKQVADEASRKFGKPCSLRNVKGCVQAWLRFEKSFQNGK